MRASLSEKPLRRSASLVLDYIDAPVLRHDVKRALNRGEADRQLRRSIAYAHGGRFRVRSKHDQEVWNECSRLVGNAVVHYNALVLTCGTYDAAGKFAFRIGLPYKSGGGIVAARPVTFSLFARSPGLDETDNSLLGMKALEMFVGPTGLSAF